MNSLDNELNRRLDELREQNLFRELRRVDSAQGPQVQIDGRTFLNFSSNDYLGLAHHPQLAAAAIQAINQFGAGAGASRLISGSLAPFHELEGTLAAFKKTEAALTFSTGYAAAVGTISALMGKDDIIILDKLVHASIVDAARLAEAKLRIVRHNDLNDLADKLEWATQYRAQHSSAKILIVTESVFSMDGDRAPLREIVDLKDQHDAWLMVDEAHATGILGRDGRGLADELGVSHRVEIQMGTLGKAIGASGGYICGSRALIDYLVNRARSFIFSTASVPAAAAAATAGLKIVQSAAGETLRQNLFQHVRTLNPAATTAILPLMVGDEKKAAAAATALREQNIYVPAIRYPTVARSSARLRITLTAAHTRADIDQLRSTLQSLGLHFQTPASS